MLISKYYNIFNVYEWISLFLIFPQNLVQSQNANKLKNSLIKNTIYTI